MVKRPMCLLCFLMVLSLGTLELMGIPLIRGNPLPVNVQEQIEAHPGSMICGEVEQYENTEFSQSVYLKKTYLIHQSKKFPIENVRIFLKKEEDLKPGMWILVSHQAFNTQHFSTIPQKTSPLIILPLHPFSAIIPHRAISLKIIRRSR